MIGKYPSIGSNTILRTFTPTYYTTIDQRVMDEFSPEHEYMFLPKPDLEQHEGIHFWHRPVPLWPSDMEKGIDYQVVMHAQIQLAYYMGFTTMLMIGVDHTLDRREHFWGIDEGMRDTPDQDSMAEGYKTLREGS